MAHCVNYKHAEIKALAKDTGLHPAVLAAKVAVWQEENNNFDRFPTIDELKQSNETDTGLDSITENNDEKIIKSLNKFAKNKKINLNFIEFEKKGDFITYGNYDQNTHQINLNKDKVNASTLLHEIAHPFVTYLNSENPELFDKIYEESKKLYPEINSFLDNESYSKMPKSWQQEEYIVRAIQKEFKNEDLKVRRSILNEFLDFIKELFGIENNIKIPEDATIKDLYQIILSNNAIKLNHKITDKVARRELEKIDKYFEDKIEKINKLLITTRNQLLNFKSNVKIGDIQVDNNVPEGVDLLEYKITEEIYNNQLFNIEDRIDDLETQIESLESQKKTNQDKIRENLQGYYNIETDDDNSKILSKIDFNDLIGSKKNEVVDKEGVSDIFKEIPELSAIGNQQQYSEYLDSIFPDSKDKDIVYRGTHKTRNKQRSNVHIIGGVTFFTKSKKNALLYSLSEEEIKRINQPLDNWISFQEIGRPDLEIMLEEGELTKEQYDKEIKNIESELKKELDTSDINLGNIESSGQIEVAVLNLKNTLIAKKEGLEITEEALNKGIQKAIDQKKDSLYYNAIDSPVLAGEIGATNNYIVFEPEQIHILGSKQDVEGFKNFVKKDKIEFENNEVVDEVEDFSKENSKVLFNNKSKVTVDEVLDNIINNFNDLSPIGKELVTKAKNLKNKTGANVKFVKESVLETENTVMQIDAKTNTIEISKERLAKVNSKIAVESFLHELGHAQSLQALINPITFEEKQFAELINKMFKWYGDLSNGSESYGFKNEAEFVSELYTNKAFQDEIRALDVEENPSYWKQFINAVRRLFGLAKSKQSDLLIEQIITFVESDRTSYTGIGNRRVVFAKRIEDDSQYSSLESKLDNFNVAAKKAMITIQEKTVRSNRKKPTEAKEDRIRENKELLDTLDKYSKVQKWKAVIGYTQSFANTIQHVDSLLDTLLDTKNIYEDKLDDLIKRYKDYLSAYDLLPEIKELMSQADLKQFELTAEEKEDYKELKLFLAEANKKHDSIESKFLAISKAQVLQDFSNPLYNTEVETKQRDELLKEYNSLSDKGGLTADQYISKMLSTRDLDDYKADLKASAEKTLNDPSKDITMVSGKLEDSLNIKSKTIQIVNQILAESFDKVKALVITKTHQMGKTFDKFVKEKGNKKLSELNKNLIEKDSTGQVYLKGKYNIKFKEAFDNELRPILKARREYVEQAVELGIEEKGYLASKEFKEFNNQIGKWYKTHTIKDAKRKTVPKTKYLNKDLTGIEKEILDGYIKINKENDNIEGFDSLVTNIAGAEFHKLPSKSKSDLERALELDVKGLTKDKWTDLTKIKTDDIGIDNGSEEKNNQGDIIRRVKTAYRGQIDPKEQSLDLETMFRNEYWNGQNFKEKTAIESKLLLVTDIAKSKEYYTGKNKVVVKGELSNTYKKLVGMMERNVYDIYSTYGGSFGPADINKITNALNGYAAGLAMTFNLASGVTNIANGLTQVFIEAVGGHRFNVKTFTKAEAKYTKEMMNGNLLKDMGKSVKTSYFNQLLEMFDVFGGLGQNEQDAIRNSFIKKVGSRKTGNFLNESGEHAMHSILTQSILDGIKAMDENNNYLDKDGNVTTEDKGASLADMLYFDSHGQLQMNSKVAYSGFNLTTKYHEGGKSQINLMIKAKVFNLFGVYDIKYKNEISKAWWGKAVMMFKNFFLGAAAYRYTGFATSYKKKSELTDDDRFYNSADKEFIEGTYTTLVRFLRETGVPNLKMLQTMYMNYNNLTEYEKANLRKATLEIMMTMVILPSIGLLLGAAGGDDKDNKLLWFAMYTNRRLTQELAQFRNPIEATRMIQNPVAGIRFIQNGLNFIYDVATPINLIPGENESVFGYLDENSKGQNLMGKHLGKLIPIVPQLGVDYKQRYNLEFGK